MANDDHTKQTCVTQPQQTLHSTNSYYELYNGWYVLHYVRKVSGFCRLKREFAWFSTSSNNVKNNKHIWFQILFFISNYVILMSSILTLLLLRLKIGQHLNHMSGDWFKSHHIPVTITFTSMSRRCTWSTSLIIRNTRFLLLGAILSVHCKATSIILYSINLDQKAVGIISNGCSASIVAL